ncbi:hypothetical protein [Ciceribacter sp. L1K22]|uniref:hypothetical protein n=1 Tax=Ciceribacter sp. L1K22 TaxID=2820275 RepID=UPI001ABDB50D|nr:hypothetical protein [Ciceribacter sp. L1K22]MBO3760393.1 hypothetical protein [Ciceribacter sp. L1K22]
MPENGLYARCGACEHVFLVARLPMPVAQAAALAERAACSQCGETKRIFVSGPPATKEPSDG